MNTKHCKIMCRFKFDVGYDSTERAEVSNSKLDRLGLIIVKEVTFIYTEMEVISQYSCCS